MQYQVLNNWLTTQSRANRPPLFLPVFPCYVQKNRQFSILVERPPLTMFSNFVVFSVGYGLFPLAQKPRPFLCKTGIFFRKFREGWPQNRKTTPNDAAGSDCCRRGFVRPRRVFCHGSRRTRCP